MVQVVRIDVRLHTEESLFEDSASQQYKEASLYLHIIVCAPTPHVLY